MQFPKIEDVRKWLDLNEIGSTQPFTAFSAAFERAGADSTPIKVDRANREVCDRAAHWRLLPFLERWCPNAEKRTAAGAEKRADTSARVGLLASDSQTNPVDGSASGWSELGAAIDALSTMLADFAQLFFRGALWFLADHGYRPGKVLLWISVTVGIYWVIFMLWLRVVAFSSKPKPDEKGSGQTPRRLRPISILFLFDRLLPHYQIISANYDIDQYYKRIPTSQVAAKKVAANEAAANEAAAEEVAAKEAAAKERSLTRVRRLRIFEWRVEPVISDTEIDRIENWLLVLRILGVVFAVFLAAAFGALFVR